MVKFNGSFGCFAKEKPENKLFKKYLSLKQNQICLGQLPVVLLLILGWMIFLPGCHAGDAALTNSKGSNSLTAYTLDQPEIIIELPALLNEISGLTDFSDHKLACVQDEDGIVFIYDLHSRNISCQIHFGPQDDYEGLTRVNDRLFALTSKGVLFEINLTGNETEVCSQSLGIHAANNEGLCYDPQMNRLLIVPKSRLGKGKSLADKRAVFAFDLKSMVLQPDPVMIVSVAAVQNYAEINGFSLPEKNKKKGKRTLKTKLRFLPSSLAVHPVFGEIFILSAIDSVLVVFDRKGNVTGYAKLDKKLFPQPEGITFFSNGDMVISNESAGKSATLLIFIQKK
jgi:uncharacterized protein YjiK